MLTSYYSVLFVLSASLLFLFCKSLCGENSFNFCLQLCPPLYTRDRNGQKTGTEMLLWSVSEVVKTPPEVKPQPQESFHIFNSSTSSAFFFLPPSNVPFLRPCSGCGFSELRPVAHDLTGCFHENIKSKLSVISPSRAVTFVTHTCIHGSLLRRAMSMDGCYSH